MMAASQLQAGLGLIYRNVGFNTYGVLNVSAVRFAQHIPNGPAGDRPL